MTTPQREHWDGHPVELGDAWILRKGEKVARCILVSHELGWELRLMTTDLLRSQVCRSSEEILSTHEAWKAAMLTKGWAKKTAKRKGAAKRELISPRGDARYIRRDAKGRIKESDDVGLSQKADRRTKAKTRVKSGQGDKGDR